MQKSIGFTLLEMVATLSVAGTLAFFAVPSFHTMVLDARRTAAVNDFLQALFLARSEALTRGEVVSVCKSPDQQQCANRAPEWTAGWIVFVNRDREEPPHRDPDETLIAAFPGRPSGRITANRQAFSFRPYYHAVINGTVTFCDRRGSAHARAIIINRAGRPRLARRSSDRTALRCPPG
jgi:type IV fimbrial biogenesis protein FimT